MTDAKPPGAPQYLVSIRPSRLQMHSDTHTHTTTKTQKVELMFYPRILILVIACHAADGPLFAADHSKHGHGACFHAMFTFRSP